MVDRSRKHFNNNYFINFYVVDYPLFYHVQSLPLTAIGLFTHIVIDMVKENSSSLNRVYVPAIKLTITLGRVCIGQY